MSAMDDKTRYELCRRAHALSKELGELVTDSGCTPLWGDRERLAGDAESLRSLVVGTLPTPSPWDEPCDGLPLLVSWADGDVSWVDVRSQREPEGLIVWMRALDLGGLERLTQVSRLALAGSLIGPISHEINNAVQSVSSAAYLIQDCLAEGDEIEDEDIEQLSGASKQLQELGGQLQQLVRTEMAGPELIDPIHILRSHILALLKATGVSKVLEIELDLPQTECSLQWPKAECELLLGILLSNAAQAARDANAGPELVIKASASEGAVSIDIWNAIEAEPATILEAPFDSSKRSQRHLGVGLSAARALVAARGGDLTVEPADGGVRTRLQLRSIEP